MIRETRLGEFLAQKTRGIVPGKTPSERFELYSVPSFDSRSPEIVFGAEIGSNKQVVEPGTVLLCKINPRINRAWVVGSATSHQKIASTEWITFPPCPHVEPKYLAYFLSQSKVRDYLAANASGVGGSLMRVKRSTVENLPLPLPALHEQRRIVAEIEKQFSRLDEAVANLRRVEAKLKRYKAAVLALAATGKLDDAERPTVSLMEPEISELPRSWRWATVSDVGEIIGGLTKNPRRATLPRKLPYLRVANVFADELRLDDIEKIGVGKEELSKLELKRGDLLIVEGNGSAAQVGRAAIWDGSVAPCVHQNHIIKVRLRDAEPRWVLNWLLSPLGRQRIQEVASSTSGLYTLSISKVARLPVPLPPVVEQRRIVAEVDRRLSLIGEINLQTEVSLKRAERLRQTILAKAFGESLRNP